MLAPDHSRRTLVCLLTVVAVAAAAWFSPARALGETALTWPLKSVLPGFVPSHQRQSGPRVARGHAHRLAGRAARAVETSADGSAVQGVRRTELVESLPAPVAVEAESDMELTAVDPLSLDPADAYVEAGDCGCDACQPASYQIAPGWGPQVLPGFWVDHLSILGGVHGFKNPANRGEDGSFGFHTGLNYGTPAKNILLPRTIGLQLGFEAHFSNFEGARFTPADRRQYFLTTGVFRRVDCGLQGGIVFDYLWDDWYYNVEAGQVRGELSLALSERNTYGVWFASNVSSQTTFSRVDELTLGESWETTDIYAIFYRSRLLAAGTGEGRLFGGFTGQGDGIVGIDSKLPLHNGWALETDFTYLIPKKDTLRFEREAWNVAVNLVWYPGSLACGSCYRYHRPLFDVADNGSMILRRKD